MIDPAVRRETAEMLKCWQAEAEGWSVLTSCPQGSVLKCV
jgi:hypothetical protein